MGGVIIEGREAVIEAFQQRHNGVREIKNPILVLHQGKDIFAELDMDVLQRFYLTKLVSFVR